MSKVINFSEVAEMKNTPSISVEKVQSFIFRTDYRNVPALVSAAEKYDVKFPEVVYLVTCCGQDGKYMCEFYLGFEDYGTKYFDFGIPVNLKEEELESYIADMLVGNLDNMCWDEAIKVHLDECGIDYEEDNDCECH